MAENKGKVMVMVRFKTHYRSLLREVQKFLHKIKFQELCPILFYVEDTFCSLIQFSTFCVIFMLYK